MNSSLLVYKSSAGSGKTTALVGEYLFNALANPSKFSQIVAITFTIKATNEMKSRVIETLIALSKGEIKPEYHSFLDKLNEKYEMQIGEIIGNAKVLLGNILHGYSYFAFSTIDSFVVRLVRSFAFDLKLPLNFGIELQTQIIIDEAVASLLNKAGYDENLTNFLVKFIGDNVSEEKNTRIDSLLGSLSMVLFNDSYSEFVESLNHLSNDDLYNYSNTIIKKYQTLKSELSKIGNDALSIIQNAGLDEKDFYYGSRGIYGYYQKLAESFPDKLKPNSWVLKTIQEDKWTSKSINVRGNDSFLAIKDLLIQNYQNSQRIVPEFITVSVLRNNVEVTALLKQVQEIIYEYYNENGVVHLSETLKRVGQIVDNEQIPFIYERLGNQYSHYLIDEFQDTSSRQWQNLLPLIESSLSENKMNLLVGDAKQSIYRWRGGNFEQFIDLPKIPKSQFSTLLKNRENVLARNYKEQNLSKNFRSASSIVIFNNSFYRFCVNQNSDNEILEKVFKDIEQETFSRNEGFVSLTFIEKDNIGDEAIASFLIQTIEDLKSRNYQWKDIAILSRKNKQLSIIADVLIKNDIPIITSQSLQLIKSPTILFLIHIIRWIYQPDDSISALGVYQFLTLNNYLEKDLLGVETNSTDFKFESLSKELQIPISTIDMENVTQIIEIFAYKLNLYEKDYPFIIHFLNFSHRAQTMVGNSISSFISYLDKNIEMEYVALPDTINAVNLLTIHKSKGLEFPVVLYFDFKIGSGKRSDYLSVNPSVIGIEKPEIVLINNVKLINESYFAEEKIKSEKLYKTDSLNVAYVATTRAKDELFIYSEQDSEYYKYLRGFAQSESNFESDETRLNYCYGKKNIRIETNELEVNNELNYHFFEPWQNIQKLNKSIFSDDSDNSDEKIKGRIIHNIMANIHSLKSIDEFSNYTSIEMGDEIFRKDIYKLVSYLKNESSLKFIFDDKWYIMNERSIVTKNGEYYRPDRVMIAEEEIIIIDYKYSCKKETASFQIEKYIKQIQNYSNLLAEMYPNHQVSGYILWVKNQIVLDCIE